MCLIDRYFIMFMLFITKHLNLCVTIDSMLNYNLFTIFQAKISEMGVLLLILIQIANHYFLYFNSIHILLNFQFFALQFKILTIMFLINDYFETKQIYQLGFVQIIILNIIIIQESIFFLLEMIIFF